MPAMPAFPSLLHAHYLWQEHAVWTNNRGKFDCTRGELSVWIQNNCILITGRTDSTISEALERPVVHLHLQSSPGRCCKTVQSPLLYRFGRKPRRNWEQIAPVKHGYKFVYTCIMFIHTCVAMYAIDGAVTWVIPWIRALPDLVALLMLSTELGDVNTCL